MAKTWDMGHLDLNFDFAAKRMQSREHDVPMRFTESGHPALYLVDYEPGADPEAVWEDPGEVAYLEKLNSSISYMADVAEEEGDAASDHSVVSSDPPGLNYDSGSEDDHDAQLLELLEEAARPHLR